MNDQVAESDEVPRPARKRRGCRAAVVAGVALVLVAAGLVAAKVARRSHRPVAAPSVGCWAEFTTPQSDDQGHYDPPITIMVGGRLSPGDLNVRLFTAGLVAASSTPKLVTVNGVPAKLAAAKVALLNAPRDAHPYEFYAWVELGSQLDELQVAVEDESGALRVFHYVRDKAATRQRLEALAAQPAADAEAHLRLGRVLKADDAPAAIAEYRKALETDPKHPRAHLYLSEALAGTGRLGEALTEAQAAVDSDSESYDAQGNLGRVLLKLGRPAEAVAPLQKAKALAPFADMGYDRDLASALGQPPPPHR